MKSFSMWYLVAFVTLATALPVPEPRSYLISQSNLGYSKVSLKVDDNSPIDQNSLNEKLLKDVVGHLKTVDDLSSAKDLLKKLLQDLSNESLENSLVESSNDITVESNEELIEPFDENSVDESEEDIFGTFSGESSENFSYNDLGEWSDEEYEESRDEPVEESDEDSSYGGIEGLFRDSSELSNEILEGLDVIEDLSYEDFDEQSEENSWKVSSEESDEVLPYGDLESFLDDLSEESLNEFLDLITESSGESSSKAYDDTFGVEYEEFQGGEDSSYESLNNLIQDSSEESLDELLKGLDDILSESFSSEDSDELLEYPLEDSWEALTEESDEESSNELPQNLIKESFEETSDEYLSDLSESLEEEFEDLWEEPSEESDEDLSYEGLESLLDDSSEEALNEIFEGLDKQEFEESFGEFSHKKIKYDEEKNEILIEESDEYTDGSHYWDQSSAEDSLEDAVHESYYDSYEDEKELSVYEEDLSENEEEWSDDEEEWSNDEEEWIDDEEDLSNEVSVEDGAAKPHKNGALHHHVSEFVGNVIANTITELAEFEESNPFAETSDDMMEYDPKVEKFLGEVMASAIVGLGSHKNQE